MALKFASLGSGSSGNATLISDDETYILLDCGFSVKEASRRMQRLGVELPQLSAVVVTHEHGDHIKGVPALSRKLGIPTYMTSGTFHSRDLGRIPDLRLIHNYQAFSVNDIQLTPVAVPHDAREPAQFLFSCKKGTTLGVLTDFGSITTHTVEAYSGCDGLLLEANHDRMMLAYGPYPSSLKARVSGPWGHLSNEQTAAFLQEMDTSKLQHLVVGHISSKNNTLEKAKQALSSVAKNLGKVCYACQDQGFGWLYLN